MKNFVTNFIPINRSFSIQGDCNTTVFFNAGDTIANINGMPLQPGMSITIDGNFEENDNTTYAITFNSIGGSTNNQLWAIRKTYS